MIRYNPIRRYIIMEDQSKKNENQYVITEQGDLGLGTRQLTDEEQKHVDERDKFQKQSK